MLLTRLQNSKTETFTLRFVRLYHYISAKDDSGFGADFFINTVEQVQAGYVLLHSLSDLDTDLSIKCIRTALSQHYPARYPEAATAFR